MSETLSLKPGILEQLQRFSNSPDAGDPGCLCSLCNQVIPEDECPIRFWPKKNEKWEIRLHFDCFNKILVKNDG